MADILLRYWLPWYDSVLPSPPSYISESLKKTKLSLSEKREGECNSPHVVGDRGDWLMEGAELEMGGRDSQQHTTLSDDQNLLHLGGNIIAFERPQCL